MNHIRFTASKERSPTIFGQITECIIVTKGGTPIIQELHAFVRFGWGRGVTACYNCLLRGSFPSTDTVAEMPCNWHLVKEWPSSLYCNAWNCHRVESGKIQFGAVSVVILEGGDCSRNDRRLGAT